MGACYGEGRERPRDKRDGGMGREWAEGGIPCAKYVILEKRPLPFSLKESNETGMRGLEEFVYLCLEDAKIKR